jgi:hypothetical protein
MPCSTCGVKLRLSCSPTDTAEAYLGSEPNQEGLTLAPESIWPSQSPGENVGPLLSALPRRDGIADGPRSSNDR